MIDKETEVFILFVFAIVIVYIAFIPYFIGSDDHD